MSEKQKRPRGISSGRNSSMIKCYVKGGSFVKPFLRLESMPSGKARDGWLPEVASVASGFRRVDSLDSKRNPPWPPVWSRKILKLSHNFRQGRWGGFQVDSPVKMPVARKLARSAPPYTVGAGEEPCQGGVVVEKSSLPPELLYVVLLNPTLHRPKCVVRVPWDFLLAEFKQVMAVRFTV